MLPSAPFDTAQSIYAGKSVIQLKLLPQVTGFTGVAATDLIDKTAHGFAAGRGLVFVSGTGFAGLVAGTTYYVLAVDADTFKLSATVGGAAVDITTDGTVGIFQPVSVFESIKLGHKDGREFKTIDRPDANGVMRPSRRFATKGAEEFTYVCDEAKRIVSELFGGSLSGIVKGTATIWEPDPQDATGKVALKSDTDFACDVTRDGDITFGDGDATKPSLKITSLKAGDVLWTVDAAA